MNILKTLFTIFIILVIIKMFLDFLSIGNKNIIEGMESKKNDDLNECDKHNSKKDKHHSLGSDKSKKLDQHEHSHPHGEFKPNEHRSSGRRVPDDSKHHKYKKYIPKDLDQLPLTRGVYAEIGKDFLKDEVKKRKSKSPHLNEYDAEVLGKMVWRTYVAEMEEKRARSPAAKDQVLEREIQLMNKVSQIMKSESDHHKGKGKKHHSITKQASSVSSRCSPKTHKSHHTSNMFTHIPKAGNNIEREHGYAFKGKPIHGTPKYYELSNAIEHCARDRACGGVNYDSTTGHYMLMPLHAKLEKRPHFTAFIKKEHPHPHHHKHHHKHHSRHTHPVTNQDYLPVTGIGSPMSPNLLPRPFNSLYAIY